MGIHVTQLATKKKVRRRSSADRAGRGGSEGGKFNSNFITDQSHPKKEMGLEIRSLAWNLFQKFSLNSELQHARTSLSSCTSMQQARTSLSSRGGSERKTSSSLMTSQQLASRRLTSDGTGYPDAALLAGIAKSRLKGRAREIRE